VKSIPEITSRSPALDDESGSNENEPYTCSIL